jgi:hypothetical protein
MPTFPKPIPVIPHAFLIRIHGTMQGTPMSNDVCLQAKPSSSAVTGLQVSTLVAAKWASNLHPQLPATYNLTGVGTYNLSNVGSTEELFVATGNGALTGQPLSNALASLIIGTTAVRHHTSKTYLPAPPISSLSADNQHLSPGYAASLETAWNTFWSDVIGDALWVSDPPTHSLLSYVTAKVSNIRTLPIFANSVKLPLASQNRRRPQGG